MRYPIDEAATLKKRKSGSLSSSFPELSNQISEGASTKPKPKPSALASGMKPSISSSLPQLSTKPRRRRRRFSTA